MPTLNLTLTMHQSCGTDLAMSPKTYLNSLHRRAVMLIFLDATTDQKLKQDEDYEPSQTTGIQ